MSERLRIFVAGATSAIAEETSRLFANERSSFFLVARNEGRLAAVASDLRVRGATAVSCAIADLADLSRHAGLLEEAVTAMGGIDLVFIAHGTLPDQKRCEASVDETMQALATNFLSAVSLASLAANILETERRGTIAVIGSVAGDRGRQSNYVYGAGKGGLDVFLQGLRNRLAKSEVTVLTIKPGFVDTPMTAHLPKNALFATAPAAGRAIHDAILKRRDVVYVPGFWRLVMWMIRSVPEGFFKKLSL